MSRFYYSISYISIYTSISIVGRRYTSYFPSYYRIEATFSLVPSI
jgi:hypothetical protein